MQTGARSIGWACNSRIQGIRRWVYSKIGRATLTLLVSVSLSGVFIPTDSIHAKSRKANSDKSKPKQVSKQSQKSTNEYMGPLRVFIYDVDGVVMGFNSGETFPVFLWHESTSPFHDVASSGLPQVIEVPKADWENGVRSEIPQYDRMPIKDLVGSYHDISKGIRSPGNSYYDKPITLSNGQQLNPRLYYQDAVRTHRAFRTNLAEKHTPLLEAAATMIGNKDFGPAFDLLALTTRRSLPVKSMLLTFRGHEEYEWELFKKQLIKSGYFESDADIERVFALNNPKLTINDPTSASQFGRSDMSLAKKKVLILEYIIDYVLPRRIDRENPENPRPNVLLYAEDNPKIAEMVRDLFLKKVRAVRDRDNYMNIYQPPLRLILWNLAPEWYYEEMPNALKDNPRALANKPVDLDQIMVFDSNARYQTGTQLDQRFNPANEKAAITKILSLAFDVSEATASKVLSRKTDCAALLTNSKVKERKK